MRGTWTRRRSMKENMVNPSQILTVCTLTVTLIMSLLAEPQRHTVVVCLCVCMSFHPFAEDLVNSYNVGSKVQ